VASTASGNEVEDEVVLGPAVTRLQVHRAPGVAVDAGPAGDGEDAVPAVEECTLHRDRPTGELRYPAALPRSTARSDPDAIALIASHPLRVRRVENGVMEGQQVSRGVPRQTGIDHRVGRRVLDDVDRRRRCDL